MSCRVETTTVSNLNWYTMNNIKVRVFQSTPELGVNANFEMEVKGKIDNFEKAVATSVEEVLTYLKLRRECGGKSGFRVGKPLHFVIERNGIPLCDTSDTSVFNSQAWGDVKLPNNSPKSRAVFRQRLVKVFTYAYRDVTVIPSFAKLVQIEAVPVAAKG